MNLFQIATRGIDLDSAPITPDDESPREGFRFEEPAQPQQRLRLPAELDEVFALAAQEYEIDPDVLRGIAYAESRFNPDIISGKVKSKAGAIGLMQFMPETAKEYGIEPTDPTQAIIGAAAYLRKSLDKFGGDYERAVASYNWGPNRKAYDSEDWTSKAPAETQKYLQTVFSAAGRFKDGQAERGLPQGVTPSKAGAGRGSVSPGMTNTQDVQAVGRTQQQPTLPADTSAVGSVGSAINTGLAKGVVKTGAGLGTFLQDPGGAIVSGLTGGAALLDRGMSSALSAVGIPAVPNQQVQRNAQIAAESAQQRRGDRYEAGNPLAVAGRFMEEDSRRVFQELQEQDRTQNPRLIAQQKNLSEAEGFVGNLKAAAQNPIALAGTLSESMFPMAAGVGAGSLVSRLGGSMGAVSATGTASEAGFAALNAREGVYQAVATMPLEKLAQSPRFQEILRSGNSPTDARELLANELADQAPLMTAAGTAGGTLLTNRLFGGDATAKTIAGTERMTGKELGKRVAQDTVEEVIQGVPEDLVQYGTLKQADLTKKLDLAGSAAQNTVGGFAFGVAGHGGAFARDAMTTPTVESQPTTPQAPTVTPQAPVTTDASKTQAVDNIAAAIKELEGGTTQAAPVQPGQQTADTGTAPVAQGPEGASGGLAATGEAAVAGQSESAQSLTDAPLTNEGTTAPTQAVAPAVNPITESMQAARQMADRKGLTAGIQTQLSNGKSIAQATKAMRDDFDEAGIPREEHLTFVHHVSKTLASQPTQQTNPTTQAAPQAVKAPLTRARTIEPGPSVVLQNRDRSSAPSVAQMNEIASAPDYLRTGPARVMDSGAPIVFGDTPETALLGREESVADGRGKRTQTQYMVVEAGDLLASNRADGTRVPEYEQGMPGKLRAVAGNGRAAGIAEAYTRGTAGQYKTDLAADAQSLGIDPVAIQAMTAPVLVRVMSGSDVTPDIGDRSNIAGTSRLSASEQATTDARRINLSALEFDEQGDPTTASVGQFIAGMPTSERGELLNKDGTPTRQAIDRVMAATFKQAYGSDELVQLYAQATDAEARTVMTALADAAGAMANLTDTGDLDIRGAVSEAAAMAVNARRKGIALFDMLKNADLDTSGEAFVIARFFADNIRSAKKIAEGLRNWANYAADQAQIARDNLTQDGLFGAAPVASRTDVFQRIEDGQVPKTDARQPARQDLARDGAERQADQPATEQAGAATGQPDKEQATEQEGLTAYTPAEVAARQDAATEAEAATKRAEDAATRAEAAAKQASEIAQRSVAAADTFELGGNAEDNLSGQEGPRFSRASDGKAARAALAKIMEEGVTSPDDLHALLRVPGYSKWAKSTIAGDVAASAELRDRLAKEYPGSDWQAPKLNDQGIITLYADWVDLTSDSIANLARIADEFDAPIAVRNGAVNNDYESKILRANGFEGYMGAQERMDRPSAVMFSHIRPAGGITATTPLFSQGAKSPRTPISTIRTAITKAYGNLLTRLEGKGLVTLTQTEEEAIAAAAQARADKTGGDVEAIKQAMRASVLASQRAWHGTPHRGIEKFSTDKIGTGEGAQAYGWGLYFANQKDVADFYRRNLSGLLKTGNQQLDDILVSNGGDLQKSISELRQMEESSPPSRRGIWTEALDVAIQLDRSGALIRKGGQLYEVEIPNDSDMLLWDKPLSEQPGPLALLESGASTINTALNGLRLEDFTDTGKYAKTGEQLYKELQSVFEKEARARVREGEYIADTSSWGQRKASETLASVGIKGIKYLDGTSRNAGEGSYNYVVFSGDDVQIVDVKYSKDGNLEGFFDPATGKSFLIADNLTAESAPGTLMHEVGIHMAADGKLEPLFTRAGNLLKMARDNAFIQRVQARMDEAGETSNEEAAAYIVTEYENDRTNAPASVGKWIKDFIADVRAWLFSKGVIIKADQLTVADIAAVARANASRMARGDGASTATDIRRSVRGGGQQAATQTAPAQPVSKWRDSTGRLQFAPGAMLYDFIGDKASPLLSYLGLKMASPALRTQLRRMKAEVTKAQEIAATVATESAKFSEAERNMVSDLVEKTVAAGTIPPDHAVKMAELINMVMGKQTDELVSLGMLSKDSADRWRDEYLPRYYESKMLKKDAWGEAMKNLMRRASLMRGIKGKHLKGRGLFETVPVSQQADYESLGWEVRDDGFDPTKDETVMMWRDFTAEERAEMGEIKDAGFRFVMGYMQTQKDIALGRMYRSIASDENLSSRLPTDKMTVKVPDTKVADTNVNVYGELAGRYVSPETLSVLSSQSEAQNDVLAGYRKALGLWKEGKTVLNPVSHMNNVVSNITMAHFAGVSYHRGDKYIGAVRDFVYKHKMVTEAKEAGLFSGGFSESELMQSMPAELRALAGKAESKTDKAINTAMQVMTFGLRNKMQNAYGFEDDFFKYLIYKDARSRGATPDAAVDFAQQYIFTYDDLPRGARIVRDTALPFFSYTYKALPALLHTALTQPHRFAVPAALMTAAATAAYAIASGDDDDDWYESIQKYLFDDEFRKKADAMNADDQKRLPPWMKGYMWTLGGIPRSIRVGYDNKLDKPVFLDVSRMMPGGTLIDVSPNSGGIPLFEGITPSHPLLSIGTAMLGNRDLFTGKDVVDKTDNRTEAAKKRADWMWKQIAPAITVGNYHYERVMNMIAQKTGKVSTPFRDYTGVDRMGMPTLPEYGIPHTFGIKLKPIDLELSEQITDSQNAKLIRELDAKVRSLQRMHRKGAVSDEDMSEFRADALEKRKLLRQGLTIDGDER